jgi:SpoVK/Ycf46/Vps4 family AAA+-type ATPase
VNPSIIRALRDAIEDEPENLSLREHLCEILFRAEAWVDVIDACEQLLLLSPGNTSALGYAAAAASSLGRPDLVAKYDQGCGQPLAESDEDHASSNMASYSGSHQRDLSSTEPTIRLSDVAGLKDVKEQLDHAFFDAFRNPEAASAYGKKISGGMLLYGPPGCGKTFLARAIAGELGVAFVPALISDILNPFFGESEKNLAALFERARRLAPSVLFFDEVDAIGRKRSSYVMAGSRELINVLLDELDGAVRQNTGVFVVAATNHPWDLDVALTRPGRMDRGIFVPLPDHDARIGILKGIMAGRPTGVVDYETLAAMTKTYSGADMAALCERASESAMSEAIKTGRLTPIAMTHFQGALKSVRPSALAWFDVARNYALFANSGGQWDDLRNYMKQEKLL